MPKKPSKFPPKKPEQTVFRREPKRDWSVLQKAIFQDISSGTGHTVVIARAGSGKCLGRGTPVLMFDGSIKKVEEIQSNDLLMGPDSKPRRVLSTNEGNGQLVRIVPVKGVPWICNDDHILTLVKSNHGKGQMIDISIKDFIERNKHLKRLDRDWKLCRTGVDFPGVDVPFDPYFVGLWIGDGTRGKTQIHNLDPEVIAYCKQFAIDNSIRVKATYEQDNNCYRLEFSLNDRGLAHRGTPFHLRRFLLKECNLNGQKTIPRDYLLNSRAVRLKLLAGIIDTDGYHNRNCYEIVTISDHLAEQYCFLARSLGLAAYKKLKHTSIRKIGYKGLAWRIYVSGHVDEIPVLIERKKASPRRQIKNVLCTGFSIEYLEHGPFYGFTLDGDGRFLLGDFTITHNTSTIVEGFKHIPKGKKTLMVAFNKAIAEELKQRAPSYVDCMTLHSLGFRAIKQSFGEVSLETDKCCTIVKGLIGDDRELWELNQSICKCVSLCKSFLVDAPAKIGDLMDKFGLETLDLTREQYIQHVVKTLSICKETKQIIDFDDMIWFCFVYRLNVGKFDVVFVDEAQDLNTAQMAMVLSATKISGRIIAVGDPQQAIYLFRGADSESMSSLVNKLGAKTLPLSVSYRCPESVIKVAQEIVPDIMAAPNAKYGVVEQVQSEELLKLVKAGDFVLSRTNAPLIKYCLKLLKTGVPANIQGRDIGSNLLYFIKKSKAKTINDLLEYIAEWKEIEVKRLLSEKKDTTIVLDKAECLLNLCEGITTVKALKETIDQLFSDVDDNAKVVFSTTHKAKGLERDRVFVLANTYRKGTGDEEDNLWYVAVTRAKSHLFLVRKAPKWDQEAAP